MLFVFSADLTRNYERKKLGMKVVGGEIELVLMIQQKSANAQILFGAGANNNNNKNINRC